MTEDQKILRIISILLRYPDQNWFDSLPEVSEELEQLVDVQLKNLMADFIEYVQEMGLIEYEEQYVRVFDFSKNTNLYLSTHDCTDSGKQAAELVEYKAFFLANGLDVDKEMPDYVPALLELAGSVSEQETKRILDFATRKINLLRSRFIEAKLPYAFLLDVVLTVTNRLEVA